MSAEIVDEQCLHCKWYGFLDKNSESSGMECWGRLEGELPLGCPSFMPDEEDSKECYCDNCGRTITQEEYNNGQGLCAICIDTIN